MKPIFDLYTSKSFRLICEHIYKIQDCSPEGTPFFPLYRKNFLGQKKLFNAPFMFQSYPENIVSWTAFASFLAKNQNESIEIKSDFDCTKMFPELMHFHSCTHSVRSDIQLPPTEEEYFRSLSSNMRSNLSRALRDFSKNNYEFRYCHNEQDLAQFYEMIFENYKQIEKVPAQPYQLFKEIFQRFGSDQVQLLAAFDGNLMIAGILIFHHTNTTEYAWGGTRSAYKKFKPSYFLLKTAINLAISKRKSYFSFGSSGAHDYQLIDHKRRWGCTQTPLFISSNKGPVLLSKLQTGTSWVNSVYMVAPSSLIKPLLVWIYRLFI